MKLVKSLLLAAPAAILAIGAQAADLPSKKASPVAYVKVCDAYGAGFFFIPGTDTCLKVGGYVRAQYEYTGKGGMLSYAQSATTHAITATKTASAAEDTTGWHARGRIDLDARTQSAWGTVRTVIGLRLASQSGQFAGNGTAYGATPPAQGVWAEAAFVQFAGFTAGRAAENFQFVPPYTWTGQHFWAGYPVGMKQLAYTATFGGGFSATIALEDKSDYSYMNQVGYVYGDTGTGYASSNPTSFVYPNVAPVLVGNIRLDQAWGSAQVMGTVGQNRVVDNTTTTAPISYTKNGYAVGAGVKFNLPMLAAGDTLYLTAVYADGMLDQLQGNSTSSNNPDSTNNLRGLVRNDQNLWTDGTNVGSTKGYSLGGMLTHYWTPTVRSVFGASYIHLSLPSFVTAATWANGGESNVNAYELSGSLVWAPVQNFDIGLELAYRKLNQSADSATITAANSVGASVSPSAVNARLRIQRTF